MIGFFGVLTSLGVCVVLPVLIVWLVTRAKINKDKANKEIVLAAIEKNSDLDVEKIMNAMASKQKKIKEKLLDKLQGGLVCTCLGLAMVVVGVLDSYGVLNSHLTGPFGGSIYGGAILFTIGIALLASFFIGKKMLAKEIEDEENGRD